MFIDGWFLKLVSLYSLNPVDLDWRDILRICRDDMEVVVMPKGHAAGREKKKAKKKLDRPVVITDSNLISPEVEVIRRKKRAKDD